MRRTARFQLSIFAALAAAGLAAACNPISTGSRIGTVTGRVYAVNGMPSSSAVVYLTALTAGSGGGVGNAQDVSQQAPVTNGGNGGLTFVSGGGDFQITAASGTYDLVAADAYDSSAAYVFEVRVSGGAVFDVGAVHLQACSAGSATNPCPAPYGGPNPTPQPPSTIQLFAPDQTNVQHVYYASGGEQVDVHAVGPITGADGSAQTGTLDAVFQNPASAQWAAGSSYDLAVVGSNLLVQLQVSNSYNVPALYRAVGGTVDLQQWQPAPGGTVTIQLTSVQFQPVDPTTTNAPPGAPIEIASTPPISGVVTAVNQP